MDNVANRRRMAPPKKRGPYKRYAYNGSASKVPATTKRRWNGKRLELSKKSRMESTSTVAKLQAEEETSFHDSRQNDVECEPLVFVARTRSPEVQTINVRKEEIGITSACQPFTNVSGSDCSECAEKRFLVNDSPRSSTSRTEDSISQTNVFDEASGVNEHEDYTTDFLIETLLIFATKLRHNLTYKAAENIVKLMHCMSGTSLPEATKYYWKKVISDFSPCLAVHYICDECALYVGTGSDLEIRCGNCDNVIAKQKNDLKSKNAFLYIPITYQLKQIFELTNIHDTCQKRRQKQCESAIEDVFDGELYKATVLDDFISINFSVDGFPVFDSSNSSSHPVLAIINEMDPQERKNHVLLCGLWFGSGKPNINQYLKPFVAEAQALYNEGFAYQYKGTNFTKKCRILAGVCDSVARPTLRNSTQFNGLYGCGLCLHPGEVVAKGRGTMRAYPLGPENDPFGEGLRTHDQTLEHAERKTKGIKGRSVLCDIPEFNIISCLHVDWMHCVALGVCRQFAKMWFDPYYCREDFSFSHLVGDVDDLLLSYIPTSEISRTPRKISDRVHWKAHEWVIFLLFYSIPTFQTLFPAKYVNHWSLLVDGVQLLLKTSIMKSEIVVAHRSLIQFIAGVEQLYGKEYVTFNVHLLSHLAQSVEKLGPLWTHSAFIFENENQVLLRYIKSSNGVAIQICDAVRTKCVVHSLRYKCANHMSNAQRQYLDHILKKSVKPNPSLVLENACMVGASTIHQRLNRLHYLAFVKAGLALDTLSTIESYKRALVKGEIIHSKAYTRFEKRCNHFVRLMNGEIFDIQLFYVVNIHRKVWCYALGKYFQRLNRPIIHDRRLNHLILLKKCDENLSVVDLSLVKEKVTMLRVRNSQHSIACVHPNHFELLI